MRGSLHIRKAFCSEDRGVVDADGHLIAEFYHHIDENYFEDAEANAQEYVALRSENERLRQALARYADENYYSRDVGCRARAALAGEGEWPE